MRVALVNPNRVKPPISPLGLEYVAEGLLAAGLEVNILHQLDALVGKDPRFRFFDPDRPDRNYNYATRSRDSKA